MTPEYFTREFMAKMDAETSVKKRRAQNKRMDDIEKEREKFAKIKQKSENIMVLSDFFQFILFIVI